MLPGLASSGPPPDSVRPMSSDEQQSPKSTPGQKRSFGEWLRDMPRWEKVALGIAVVAVVAGGVLTLVSGDAPETTGGGAGTPNALGAGLVPDQPGGGGTGQTAAAEGEPASKGVFRLGFSFIAGFCIGLFVRTVLKLAAIAVGFWLVMTFLLAQAELVVVDWQAINDLFSSFMERAEQDLESFKGFILGSLPAAGLGATGLVVGFKRR